MMNLNKKIYISLSFFALAFLVFVFFIIYSLLNEIKKDSQDFVVQKNSIAELQTRKENFNKLKNFYKNYQKDLEKIDNLLVDSEKPIEFIEFLEESAENSSLSINVSTSALLKPETEKWNFSNYQLSLEGSFPNVLKFLEKLETAPYLIEISNLNIQKSSIESIKFKEYSTLERNALANLTIKVYTK
ncbi:hypothetical protein AMJ49_05815 [Parcubacteria bacterium DG_74_2]|nr:MAG: hypothetical protein AMJ49_05815 [Parcubacteria bacterium DG_74_2]